MAQILAEECEECDLNCKIIIKEEDNYTINVKGNDKSKKKNKNEDSLGGGKDKSSILLRRIE